jgi:hypothetical protein
VKFVRGHRIAHHAVVVNLLPTLAVGAVSINNALPSRKPLTFVAQVIVWQQRRHPQRTLEDREQQEKTMPHLCSVLIGIIVITAPASIPYSGGVGSTDSISPFESRSNRRDRTMRSRSSEVPAESPARFSSSSMLALQQKQQLLPSIFFFRAHPLSLRNAVWYQCDRQCNFADNGFYHSRRHKSSRDFPRLHHPPMTESMVSLRP